MVRATTLQLDAERLAPCGDRATAQGDEEVNRRGEARNGSSRCVIPRERAHPHANRAVIIDFGPVRETPFAVNRPFCYALQV